MAPTLLFIHGRAQASDPAVARDPRQLEAYVLGKKRSWLGGLAHGLFKAGHQPVSESAALLPFYGNAFADAIAAYEKAGGRRPELEIGEEAPVAETKAAALLDVAGALSFDAARELSYTDPEVSDQLGARDPQRELGWGDALRVPVLRSALQFVSRKTGAPAVLIEQFLDDVAYYLELTDMREAVLSLVTRDLERNLPDGGEVIVIGHSLGSVVAYDLLTRLPEAFRVRLLVTAGCPLGYPVVQKNLLGKLAGHRPAVPAILPKTPVAWLNAYDVLDFVALVHPLAGLYDEDVPGQVTDEQTHNPTDPHSIEDYLADPDVAGPVGDAIRGREG